MESYLFPHERRISIQITTDHTAEQQCLYMGHQSPRHLLVEKRMGNCLLFSLLPRGKHCFAPTLGKEHAAVLTHFELGGLDRSRVDERQYETVGQSRPKFFNQI